MKNEMTSYKQRQMDIKNDQSGDKVTRLKQLTDEHDDKILKLAEEFDENEGKRNNVPFLGEMSNKSVNRMSDSIDLAGTKILAAIAICRCVYGWAKVSFHRCNILIMNDAKYLLA